MNQVAERFNTRECAVVDDRVRGQRGDRVLDLDAEEVERCDEVRQESRLKDDAVGKGVGDLRRQRGIAADLGVDLCRLVYVDIAVLGGGDARQGALRLR